jgi:hypothetical protein
LIARFVARPGLAIVTASRLLLLLLATPAGILTLRHVPALRLTSRVFRRLGTARPLALLGPALLLVVALLRSAGRRLLLAGTALVAILLPGTGLRSLLLLPRLLTIALLSTRRLAGGLILGGTLFRPALLLTARTVVLVLTVWRRTGRARRVCLLPRGRRSGLVPRCAGLARALTAAGGGLLTIGR